jgi:DNA replication and repair protein RecF
MARRHAFVAELDNLAYVRHAELSAAREALTVQYLPSLNYTDLSEGEYDRWQQGWLDLDLADHLPAPPTAERIAERFAATLAERRARELGAGATLYGPHRDDLRFLADRRDLRSYGSRGQQRTAALSLKLAEVQAMTQLTGEAPLLLLDDVMSELDAQRRSTLLAALEGVNQAILTTTDWEDFTPEFRRSAQCLHVSAGVITEPEPAAVGIA